MRTWIAVVAALAAAGFTKEEAERALNGEWAGQAFPVALAIDAGKKTGKFIENGKTVEGPLAIEASAGDSATFSIAGRRFVMHFRDQGQSAFLAEADSQTSMRMKRVK